MGCLLPGSLPLELPPMLLLRLLQRSLLVRGTLQCYKQARDLLQDRLRDKLLYCLVDGLGLGLLCDRDQLPCDRPSETCAGVALVPCNIWPMWR